MNIIFLIENICLRAGTERAVINEANILEKQGHNVSIISVFSNDDEKPGFRLDNKIKIIHLGYKYSRKASRFYTYFKLFLKLPHNINKLNIDVVIGSTYFINYILAFGHFEPKTIGCEHFNYDSLTKRKKRIRKAAYQKLDAVIVLTKHDASKYDFIRPNKLFVIPNSICVKKEQYCDTNSHIIISVGRLTYQKGYDLLLKVAQKVKSFLPDWKFVIYGDGEEESMLIQECHDLGLDKYVYFMGRTENVNSKLLSSSIYIMTSRFEGLPMALIEAQSCALPIVSFDCPEGPSEVIHDGCDGFLVPLGDIDLMADKIISIASDDRLRASMSKNAKKNSWTYDEKEISVLWKKMLDKVINY